MSSKYCPLCQKLVVSKEGLTQKIFHYECWGQLDPELRRQWNQAKREFNLSQRTAVMRKLVFSAIKLRTQKAAQNTEGEDVSSTSETISVSSTSSGEAVSSVENYLEHLDANIHTATSIGWLAEQIERLSQMVDPTDNDLNADLRYLQYMCHSRLSVLQNEAALKKETPS